MTASERLEVGEAVCDECGARFRRTAHDEQIAHATIEHGSADAVSFDLVPAWKSRELDTDR